MADFNPTGGNAAAPAAAAGTGGGNPTDGVTFWDPSKYAMIRDARPVPGMGVVSPATGPGGAFGGPNETQATGPISPFDYRISPTAGVQFMNSTTGNPNGMPYVNTTNTSTLGGAMNQLLQFGASADPTSIQGLQDQLVKGGYLDPTKKGFNYGSVSGTSDPTYTAYYQLLEQAIRTGTDYNAILQDRVSRDAGKKYEDALELQQDKLAKAQAVAEAALLPKTINRTTTDISDPLTAQALMTQAVTGALGRNPTTDELSQFTQALQSAQAAAPKSTIAVTVPGQYQDKSATTTGGFDPGQFTQNYVNQNFGGEKAAVGGATGFYQAALSALGAGGRGY